MRVKGTGTLPFIRKLAVSSVCNVFRSFLAIPFSSTFGIFVLTLGAFTVLLLEPASIIDFVALPMLSSISLMLLVLMRPASTFGGFMMSMRLRSAKTFAIRVEEASKTTRKLMDQLQTIHVDVSGADLSHVDLSDLGVLAGVIWMKDTIWPDGMAESISDLSDEILPNVFRVRSGTNRDRDTLVTV
jgi:hypothetical protein